MEPATRTTWVAPHDPKSCGQTAAVGGLRGRIFSLSGPNEVT